MSNIKRNLGDKEFSVILYKLIEIYNEFPKNDAVKKKLKESAYRILRKWSDLKVPNKFSLKAIELIKKYRKDSFSINNKKNKYPVLYYKDRTRFGKNKEGKSNLVYEHTVPISQFFIELSKTKSIKEVEMKLKNYSGVCWITRKEDNILSKHFRIKRPNGWRLCYEECGIVIKEF